MALSGFLSLIGRSSLHGALTLLQCLGLQAANAETRASAGPVGLHLKDEVSVSLSDSNKDILKPDPHSQRLRQSVALGEKGTPSGQGWQGTSGSHPKDKQMGTVGR